MSKKKIATYDNVKVGDKLALIRENGKTEFWEVIQKMTYDKTVRVKKVGGSNYYFNDGYTGITSFNGSKFVYLVNKRYARELE